MQLVAMPQSGEHPDPKPGLAKVDKFKLKPSPSVPAAPSDLPPPHRFCVQRGEQGYFLRFKDPTVTQHGSEVDVVGCTPNEHGLVMCQIQSGDKVIEAPLCEEDGADKEPVPNDCCVRILGDTSGQIVCAGSAYDLLIVKIVALANVNGIQTASVEHPDMPGGGARLPVCEPIEEEPDERPCCIEESTGEVVCPQGVDFPLAGKRVPLEFLVFADTAAGRVARLKCGDVRDVPPSDRAADPVLDAMFNLCEDLGGYVFLVCDRPGKRFTPVPKEESPPPKLPDVCCYDPSTGTLVCEGTDYHGLPVAVVAETQVNGKPIVSVQSERLPGGGLRVPLCPPRPELPKLPPADCCVVESSSGLTLVCDPSSHPWNGKDVSDVGQCVDTPNGRMCVIAWSDEYGQHTLEVPTCPPPPERIPAPEAEVPPAPEPIPIPVPPGPTLPPPTRPPAQGCESAEATSCRENWQRMLARHEWQQDHDRRWREATAALNAGHGVPSPGRRGGRKYGYGGIAPEHRRYARFPGLRGGRRMI